MSKPRFCVQLDDSNVEPYQWGNSDRGGCGAPLLDKGGQTLTNLRKVIKDSESPRNTVDWRNERGQNNLNYGDRLDTADNFSRNRSGDDVGLEGSRNNEAYMTKNSPSFNKGSPHFGSYNNGSYSDGSVGSPTSSSASPKKFMGALTQMSIGVGDREREMRFRREQEYQKQLRDQIEEKKRKKDEEKRGDDKTKQKEMREYLTGHYKGEIPERLKSILVVDADNSDGDIDHQQHHRQQQQQQQMNKGKNMNARGTLQSQIIYNDEVRDTRNGDDKFHRGDGRAGDSRNDRQAKKVWLDDDKTDNHQVQYSSGSGSGSGRKDENDMRSRSSQDKRGGERGGVSSNDHRTGVDDDPESPDNRGVRQGYNDRNEKKNDNGNNRNHQFQDKDGRWISEVEYGELTSLCDRLMTQQDQLQVELQHQAELIKDLQRKPQLSTSKVRGKGNENGYQSAQDVSGAGRSKSVQQSRASVVGSNSNSNSNSNMNSNSNGHGNSNSNGSRSGGVGKSEQSKRPISNDFRGDRDKVRDKDRDKDRDRHYDDNVSHGKESQQSKPLPKAAFGGSILSAPRNMFSKVSKESAGPGSVASKSTASSIKKTFLGLAFGGRASSVSKERKGKNEQGGVGGGGGGGGKDKKGATALKVPLTTHYDSEDDAYVSSRGGSRRGSDPRRYGVRTGGDSHDSMGSIGRELNGQSEYLRMDKLSQDVMSEDQLERLLVQAKSVRSTTSRQPTR